MDFEGLFLEQKLKLSVAFSDSLFQGVVKQLSEDRVGIRWVQLGQLSNYDFGVINYSKKEFEGFKDRVSPWSEKKKAFEDFL